MRFAWIARNKYTLMALIPGLYLVADIMLHKGLTRVLLPKNFPAVIQNDTLTPGKHELVVTGKTWAKAVNTLGQLQELDPGIPGFECDVYYRLSGDYFDIHHDAWAPGALKLDSLLMYYQQRGMKSNIWLDFKNLRDSNYQAALVNLEGLQKKYGLSHKILVESGRADLLKTFSDNGFYTVYYPPAFNPYLLQEDSLRYWAGFISRQLQNRSIDAVSGYYYQYPFLKFCFPRHAILTWSNRAPFSLINRFFRWKINGDQRVPICLYP